VAEVTNTSEVKPNQLVTLECNHTEINETLIQNVTWYFNSGDVKVASFSISKRTMNITNDHTGAYTCLIELANGDRVKSKEFILIGIKIQ